MSKCLSANFSRLFRSPLFLLAGAFMAAMGVFMVLANYISMKEDGFLSHLDDVFFGAAILIGVISALFVSLFFGTEYSDGTIRNKIIVGHRRSSIYLANLITGITAALVFLAAFFLPAALLGLPLLNGFLCGPRQILLTLCCCLFLSAAYTALFLLAAMLCQNKAVTVAICILLAFGILFAGAYIQNRLSEPETYDQYVVTGENGMPSTVESMPNPSYLRGTERKVYDFFYDFLPGGQALQCVQLTVARPGLLMVLSCVIVLSSTGAGLLLFERKDLK